MPYVIEDLQKLSRDAENYVHSVIILAAPSQDHLEATALHVVGSLAAVLDAMFEGISAADVAQALGQPVRPFPGLRN